MVSIGFKKFGWLSYTTYTKVESFVDALRDGKICSTYCKKCERIYFPPRAECVDCLNTDLEWREHSGKGKLITYTTIHAAPTGFETIAPYTLGMVELEAGGRAIAWVEDIKPEDLKIGMTLKLVPKILEEIEELKVVYVLQKV